MAGVDGDGGDPLRRRPPSMAPAGGKEGLVAAQETDGFGRYRPASLPRLSPELAVVTDVIELPTDEDPGQGFHIRV